MKVAILAGGMGTRISEETDVRPKPMVEIGGKPILWHIMKHYLHYGCDEFVILLGYKSYIIKEYFANYFLHQSDVTIDTKTNQMVVHSNESENWRITLVETGLETMTGGRIKRAQKYIGDETFLLTYGDGLSDVNIHSLLEHHRKSQKIMTLTAVQPEGRFGVLNLKNDSSVSSFFEKPTGDGSWINGGFFVCEPAIFDYLKGGDQCILERQPMQDLAAAGQLSAYRHSGFWKCMDTLRDKVELNTIWSRGEARWKTKLREQQVAAVEMK